MAPVHPVAGQPVYRDEPSITQVDHSGVPVTGGSFRLCHSSMPVEPRWHPGVNPASHQCYKTLLNEDYQLQLNI